MSMNSVLLLRSNLPKAYECIESLRDQCPPDLYELDDVIGSYTDPGTTLIADCITIVGGGIYV